MSYEHCETHDCDATNGCPTCQDEIATTDAIESVKPLVEAYQAMYYPTEPKSDVGPSLLDLAVACYRLGAGT